MRPVVPAPVTAKPRHSSIGRFTPMPHVIPRPSLSRVTAAFATGSPQLQTIEDRFHQFLKDLVHDNITTYADAVKKIAQITSKVIKGKEKTAPAIVPDDIINISDSDSDQIKIKVCSILPYRSRSDRWH